MAKTQIIVRLEPAELAVLDAHAEKIGVSRNEAVRDLIAGIDGAAKPLVDDRPGPKGGKAAVPAGKSAAQIRPGRLKGFHPVTGEALFVDKK